MKQCNIIITASSYLVPTRCQTTRQDLPTDQPICSELPLWSGRLRFRKAMRLIKHEIAAEFESQHFILMESGCVLPPQHQHHPCGCQMHLNY